MMNPRDRPGATVAEMLRTGGVDPIDARALLRAAMGVSDAHLVTHPGQVPSRQQRARYLAWIERRRAGEPVAYLTGSREFYSLSFKVTPAVLIPRPETELLVDLALERIPAEESRHVLDLGTGSGCVAIVVALHRPKVHVTAVDQSEAALAVARENSRMLGARNIDFAIGEWFSPLAGRRFDLILSNPPYVAAGDPHLGEGDLRFEPHEALVGGTDGLNAIRHIVARARHHLAHGGWLIFEHGHDQGPDCRALLDAAGFDAVRSWRDLAGNDRVAGGKLDGAAGAP